MSGSTNGSYVLASGTWDLETPAVLNAVMGILVKYKLGTAFVLKLPVLSVSTLDTVLILSEELSALENSVKRNLRKTVSIYEGIESPKSSNDQKGHRHAKHGLNVNGKSVDGYVTEFTWDERRHDTSESLSSITAVIKKDTEEIENLVKTTNSTYEETKTALAAAKRRYTGDLKIRALDDIAKQENVVLNSEYLVTVFVVVEKTSAKEWERSYEKLSDMIVPGTSEFITSDETYDLYGVTIFKKCLNEFIANATEKRYFVREFNWDPKTATMNKKKLESLTESELTQRASLIRLLEHAFSDLYSLYMHIKVMVVFVEAVLRYGPPVSIQQFKPILVKPSAEKHLKKIMATLESQLSTTDTIKLAKNYEKQREVLSKEGIVIDMSEVESSIINSTHIDTFVSCTKSASS